jgi:3-dehydroquinate dehydratase
MHEKEVHHDQDKSHQRPQFESSGKPRAGIYGTQTLKTIEDGLMEEAQKYGAAIDFFSPITKGPLLMPFMTHTKRH